MSYPKPDFPPRSRYRVKQSFGSIPSSKFQSGEILVFTRNTFSAYDGCHVFEFCSVSEGITKQWWFWEGTPVEEWRQYLEPLEAGEMRQD